MMAYKLTSLPNEILLYLFNGNFSLQELFHFRGLCHRVQLLIECCIAKRKSLKLFWSFLGVNHCTNCVYFWKLEDNPALILKNQFDDDLILCEPKFTRSAADWLARMFPRLAHLFILFHSRPLYPPPTQHYPVLPYLISRWPSTLVHLTLFGIAPRSIPGQEELVRELCHVMNESLPNLKQIDLYAHYLFYYNNADHDPGQLAAGAGRQNVEFIPMELTDSLLKQLERLNLGTNLPTDAPEKLLDKLESGNCTIKLAITYTYGANMKIHLEKLSGAPGGGKSCDSAGAAVAQVTHMTVQAILGRWQHTLVLDRIVSHFTGLRSLALEQMPTEAKQPDMRAVDILHKLICLPNLTELTLRNFDWSQLRDIQQQLNQTGRLQMRKITHLAIIENVFDPPQIGSLAYAVFFASIRHIFPSVQSFRLKLERSLSEWIDSQAHLAPFGALTRFELSVYPKHVSVIPHIFSRKHLRRFESEFLHAEQEVDRIGPGHAGRELWTRSRRQTNGLDIVDNHDDDDDAEKRTFVWTKRALVYDAHRLNQIGGPCCKECGYD